MSSQSNPGQSIVTVKIKNTYDKHTLPQVWDELRRKIHDAQGQLPPGASPSLVIDDFGDVYGILLSISGEGYSTQDIQDYAKYLRKQLLLVKNVAKINIWGEQTENVYIEMSRARMSRMGVTLEAVTNVLSQRNLVVPAGDVHPHFSDRRRPHREQPRRPAHQERDRYESRSTQGYCRNQPGILRHPDTGHAVQQQAGGCHGHLHEPHGQCGGIGHGH